MTSHKNGPTSSNVTRPHLLITGTRGIPAQHGGFETFAEELARYLTQQGWHVSVYCQIQPEQQQTFRPHWQGIKRIPIVVHGNRAHHTLIFDYKCLRDALTRPGLILTLGYGGAIFNLLANLKKRPYLINMDGLEWKRQKWPWYAKIWLKFNEQIAMQAATHLI
ncbi:MAG: DUF1972 domain-containing protein, partial [Hydrogenovibrio sp.]|uniref:DUF1972 domain-containing protein n=1 Tax=Hydrogenovibrio sp. TaxID=2065821 RepID=UPI0028704C3E